MTVLQRISVVVTGLALVMGLSTTSQAAFKIKFQQAGYADVVVTDNVSPQDLSTGTAGEGAIQLGNGINKFTFGTFEALFITSTSNSPGTPQLGQLDIVSVFLRNTSNNDAALTVSLTDTGFTFPAPPLMLDSRLTGQLQSGIGSVSFQSFADDNNVEFGTQYSTALVTKNNMDATSGVPVSFDLHATNAPFNFNGSYSVSNVATYTLSAGAMLNVSSGKTTLVTPEPASVGIWAAGVLGIVVVGRVRRRRT